MENKNITAPLLISQVKSYAETRFKLEKFKAIKKGSPIVANVIMDAMAVCCLILGLLYGSISLAFYLSSIMDSPVAGFGAVGALFIVFAVVLLSLKKVVQTPISKVIIKKVL